MKFSKIFITIFILTLAISCTVSKLEITKPDSSFFLSKMKDFGDLKSSNGGQTISIKGTNYTFEKPIAGLGGVYKGTNEKGEDNYMIVVPAGEEAHTVIVEKEDKETLDKIIDIVGEENVGGLVGALTTEEGFKDQTSIDNIKANLPEDKQKELQDLIDSKNLANKNLGTYKKYPEDNN